MEGWDIALLAAAAYLAVTSLVRLIVRRRNQLVREILRQAGQESQRRQADAASRRLRRNRTA